MASARRVLVTGASRGIGLATALMLAGKGYRVVGMARNPPSRRRQGGTKRLRHDQGRPDRADAHLGARAGPWRRHRQRVAPGPIGTELFHEHNPPEAAATRAIFQQLPVGRIGRPEEVAAAIAFFLSEEATFVTGQTLYVCGSLSVGRATL